MRGVFVLIDTVNRFALGCYGGTQAKTPPNFDRLTRPSLTIDNHHVESLPCIPVRRSKYHPKKSGISRRHKHRIDMTNRKRRHCYEEGLCVRFAPVSAFRTRSRPRHCKNKGVDR